MHASDFRVLGKVLAGMQWGNIVHAPIILWGKEMGIARQTVWRSIKVLRAKGVLFPDFRGRRDHYVLSYTLAYRGGMRYLSRLRLQQWAWRKLEELAQALEQEELMQGEGLRGVSPVHAR